ncbi:MAG: SAM-dependent chlorinase/fluorinase [Chlorobium sp.]
MNHMQHHPVIVLMTDFGLADTFIGQMKGVIVSLAPSAQIIDLTHAISPQNIVQGAFLLGKSRHFFPDGTIFIAIVDPGVGTSRKAIAIKTDRYTFLAPDNGLLTKILQSDNIRHCVQITKEHYMLRTQSSTFHGRDVFSPAAAHLASGVSPLELGNEMDPSKCTTILLPDCTTSDNGRSWNGQIISVDHFGNLVTSIDSESIDFSREWLVETKGCPPLPISITYGEVADQQLLAYVGSSGMIEIAVRNGHAAKLLGLGDGAPVWISAV